MSVLTMLKPSLKATWKIEADGTFQGFVLDSKYHFNVNETFITILDSNRNRIVEVKRNDLKVGVPVTVKDRDGATVICRITLLK